MMVAVSSAELVLRMVLSVLAFIGLAWGATWLARSRFGPLGRSELAVRSRHQLSRSASVAILRAGRRHFLLGVTDGGVTVLAEGDDLVEPAEPDRSDERDWPGTPAGRSDSDGADKAPAAGGGAERWTEILDVRAGDLLVRADGTARTSGAGKHHGSATGAAPTGMRVIEALRRRTARRL